MGCVFFIIFRALQKVFFTLSNQRTKKNSICQVWLTEQLCVNPLGVPQETFVPFLGLPGAPGSLLRVLLARSPCLSGSLGKHSNLLFTGTFPSFQIERRNFPNSPEARTHAVPRSGFPQPPRSWTLQIRLGAG